MVLLLPSGLRLVEITICRMSRNYRVNLTLQSPISGTNSLSKLGDTTTGVPGCLLRKTLFYLEIKASQYIQDTVSSGYKILFFDDQPPPKFCKRNNKSALDNSAFVYTELKKLESLGCIKSVKSQPPLV